MRKMTICFPTILHLESLGIRSMFYGGTAYEDDLENAPIFSNQTSGDFPPDSPEIADRD